MSDFIFYLSGGLLGDFMHQLSVIKEKYLETGKKGILYLSNQGDAFRSGLDNTFNDTYHVIISQEYIEKYEFYNNQKFDFDLTYWRNKNGSHKNWHSIYSETYNIEWGKHKWLNVGTNEKFKNCVLINSTDYRWPANIDFHAIYDIYRKEIIYISHDERQYNAFVEKTGLTVEFYKPTNFTDLCIAINSCKLFLGSQSAPMSIAKALHKKIIIGNSSVTEENDAIHGNYFIRGLDSIFPNIYLSLYNYILKNFDWRNYLNDYPDLREKINNKEDAWNHWINYGKNEGRIGIDNLDSYESFNWQNYVNNYPDLQKRIHNKQEAWSHWVSYGKNEGRNCISKICDVFDWQDYLTNYPDLQDKIYNREEAWNHLINFGINEGRICYEYFNWQLYHDNYSDVKQQYPSKEGAWYHWINYGKKEGRICSENFNWQNYVNNYPDLQKRIYNKEDAWNHWINFGKKEGRIINSKNIELLKIFHNSGFFSCCSMKLQIIIHYVNQHKKLPEVVDSSEQFAWYKINNSKRDITFDYFEHYDNYNVYYNRYVNYSETYQYTDYSKLQYHSICPFITKYFSPSLEIKKMIENLEKKYNINYENTCVLFYRGNDKNTETAVCSYQEYISYAQKMINLHPNIVFLVQSDETEFIQKMTSLFPNNTFYMKDEIRHMSKCSNTVDKTMKDEIDKFSKYYLAITIMMSKCKYIVCGSGNCSIWIMFYRGNSNNVYQNLNGSWIKNI